MPYLKFPKMLAILDFQAIYENAGWLFTEFSIDVELLSAILLSK